MMVNLALNNIYFHYIHLVKYFFTFFGNLNVCDMEENKLADNYTCMIIVESDRWCIENSKINIILLIAN